MEFLPQSVQELIQNQPTWVYILILIIPFCMALSFRELMCWFWKVNKVVGKLERIDKSLQKLEGVLSAGQEETVTQVEQASVVPTAKTVNAEESRQGPTSAGNEDFKLE